MGGCEQHNTLGVTPKEQHLFQVPTTQGTQVRCIMKQEAWFHISTVLYTVILVERVQKLRLTSDEMGHEDERPPREEAPQITHVHTHARTMGRVQSQVCRAQHTGRKYHHRHQPHHFRPSASVRGKEEIHKITEVAFKKTSQISKLGYKQTIQINDSTMVACTKHSNPIIDTKQC